MATEDNYRPFGDGSVHGDEKAFKRSNASTDPGYSTEASRPGMSKGQLRNGMVDMGKITDATRSDPADRSMPMNPDI